MGNSDRLSLFVDNKYKQSIDIAILLSVIDGNIFLQYSYFLILLFYIITVPEAVLNLTTSIKNWGLPVQYC